MAACSVAGYLPAAQVLSAMPAGPHNLEALAMLQGGAQVHGSDPASCIIWMDGGGLAVVQGSPAAESIRIALEDCPGIATILTSEAFGFEWPAILPGWRTLRVCGWYSVRDPIGRPIRPGTPSSSMPPGMRRCSPC